MKYTYARLRLTEWGKWGRWGVPGYPRQSAHLSVKVNNHDSDAPKHIQEVEGIVLRAEAQDRQILIAYYVQGGSKRGVAIRLGVPKTTFSERLDRAVCYVENELDSPAVLGKFAHSM